MFNQGMPVEDIADVANISVPYTKNILRNMGIVESFRCGKIDDTKLVEMQASGAKLTEMASVFSCSTQAISCHIKKLGLRSQYFVSKESDEKMLKLRESGYTNNEIASRVGCSPQTVLRHIGEQPAEITNASIQYAAQLRKLKNERRQRAKAALIRSEQLRIEAEKREQARVEKENIIKNMLSGFGISMDNFHIDSAEHGDSILDNLRRKLNIA